MKAPSGVAGLPSNRSVAFNEASTPRSLNPATPRGPGSFAATPRLEGAVSFRSDYGNIDEDNDGASGGLVRLAGKKTYTASGDLEAQIEEEEEEKMRLGKSGKLQKSIDLQEMRNVKAKADYIKVQMADRGMLDMSDDVTAVVEMKKKAEATTGVLDRASFAWRRIQTTCTPLTPHPPARSGHSSFILSVSDPRIFVHGGAADAVYMDDLYVFHTVQERWTKLHTYSPPSARSYHTSLLVAPMPGERLGKNARAIPRLLSYGGYFKGGLVGSVSTMKRWEVAVDGYDGASKVYAYRPREHPPKKDQVTNVWDDEQGHGDVPLARCNHTANVIAGRYVLVFGGWLGKFVSDIYVLDTHTYRWEYKATRIDPADTTAGAVKPRAGHTATMLPGRQLLVFGGQGDGGQLGDLCLLNVATMTWIRPRPKGFKPSVRSGHTACFDATKGKVFFFGGWDGIRLRNDVAVLDVNGDPYTDWAWDHISVHGKIEGRVGHSAALIGSRMYVFGGWTDGGKFSSDTFVLETSRARRAFIEAAKKAAAFGQSKLGQVADVLSQEDAQQQELEDARRVMAEMEKTQLTEEQKAKIRQQEEDNRLSEKVDTDIQRAKNLILNRVYMVQARAKQAEKERRLMRNRLLANLRRAYVESSVKSGYSLTESLAQMRDISDEHLLRYVEAAEMGAGRSGAEEQPGGVDAPSGAIVAVSEPPASDEETIESALALMTGNRADAGPVKPRPPPPLDRALDNEDYLQVRDAQIAASRNRDEMTATERAEVSAYDAVRFQGAAAAGILQPVQQGGLSTQVGPKYGSMVGTSPHVGGGALPMTAGSGNPYDPSPLTAEERALLPESQRLALERAERAEALSRIAAGGGVDGAYEDIETKYEEERRLQVRIEARKSMMSADQDGLQDHKHSLLESPRHAGISMERSDQLRASAIGRGAAATAANKARQEQESERRLGPALQAALAARRDGEFTYGSGSVASDAPPPPPPPKVVPRPRRHDVANISDSEFINAVIEGRNPKPLPIPVPAAQAKALPAPSSAERGVGDDVEHIIRTAQLARAYQGVSRLGLDAAIASGNIPPGIARSVAAMQAAIRGFLERRRLRAARAATRIQAMIRGRVERARVTELKKVLNAALNSGADMESFVKVTDDASRKSTRLSTTANETSNEEGVTTEESTSPRSPRGVRASRATSVGNRKKSVRQRVGRGSSLISPRAHVTGDS